MALTLLDSAAEFEARIREIGTPEPEALVDLFKAAGITTFATLSYKTRFTPGMPDGRLLNGQLLKPVLGEEFASNKFLPYVCRLFTEAYALAAGDLARRVEQKPDAVAAHLPQEEREARRAKLLGRLGPAFPGTTSTIRR